MAIAERAIRPLRAGQRLTVQEFLRQWEAMPEVKSSASYDLGVKKALYQTAGVREYVAILMQEEEIRWRRLVKGVYELCRPTAKGVFHSRVFPGLWLDGPALWKYDMARLWHTLERGLRSAEHAAFVKKLVARKN